MSARIPRRFHFVFGLAPQTEPFHLAYYLCLESCRVVNRPESITLSYHYEPYGRYWEMIKEHLALEQVELEPFVSRFAYRDRFTAGYSYAHHADFIRLERLLSGGGVYADIDTLFVNPVPDELFEHPFVLGREDEIVSQSTGRRSPSLCNAFIMSEPGAEFGRLWLERMTGSFDGSWSNHSTLLPQRLSEERPELIHIEPARTFYRHMWTREGIRTLLEEYDPDTAGVVSLHLWSHLWWSERRRDFSDFSAARLTEEYVRRSDTTYAVLARRFLPPSRPRLLFVSPVVPRPTGDGRSMRAYRVIRSLASRYEVDLLVAELALRVRPRAASRLRDRALHGPWRSVRLAPCGLLSDPLLTLWLVIGRIHPRLQALLRPKPADWYPLTPRLRLLLRRTAGAGGYAVIHLFRLYLAPLGLYLHRLAPAARLDLDLDELESHTRARIARLQSANGEAALARRSMADARAYACLERRTLSSFQRIYLSSVPERERLARLCAIDRGELLPNSLAPDASAAAPGAAAAPGVVLPAAPARPRRPDGGCFTLLFVGTMDYYPNRDAVRFLAERVMPLLRAAAGREVLFRVVGSAGGRRVARIVRRLPGVDFVGQVSSLAEWYRSSDAVVVPLRAGGGTRIKVLEAFAHSRPIVSTSLGVEGIPARNGEHLLVGDTASAFAEQCARLAENAALGRRLAERGLELLRSLAREADRGLLQ